jgi:HlyD family secretion protein
MVRKTVLKAPLSGLITALNVEKGERAVPGIQSNPIATLMTIADMSVIEAEIRVDESDIVAVQLGATAEVEVDAIRDVKFAGVVTEIGQSPIQAASSGGGGFNQNEEGKEFKVVVRLKDPPPTLRPGFTATADIVTATRRDVLVVPLQALTAREVEIDASGTYVPPPEPTGDELPPQAIAAGRREHKKEIEGVFLRRDGRARFRPVKTGITGDMDIEVLEGLQAGDEVVTGPYQALRTLKEWDRIDLDPKRTGADAVRKARR